MARKSGKIILLVSLGLIILLIIVARPPATEGTTQNRAKLRIMISGQRSGSHQSEPIDGADVLVMSNDGGFQATPTTDSQGTANAVDVPFGKTLIQVTAQGWITDGHSYDLNQKEQTIAIKLKPSQEAAPTPTPTPTPNARIAGVSNQPVNRTALRTRLQRVARLVRRAKKGSSAQSFR
ncbi:MAG TPA: carboxypeptidase-like regulatory domain-containing protein [Pyrinomonadaceae bacterium]|nr:carboxypeptidase-like regulatory domain-containing protein [Pyrinomonadaceae bacterium]